MFHQVWFPVASHRSGPVGLCLVVCEPEGWFFWRSFVCLWSACTHLALLALCCTWFSVNRNMFFLKAI